MHPVCIEIVACRVDAGLTTPALPSSLVIKYPEQEAKTYIFGHSTFNNSTFTDAKKELIRACAWRDGICSYNVKEMIKIMEYHFGIPRLAPEKIWDISKLAYLYEPYSDAMHFSNLINRHAKLFVERPYHQRLYENMAVGKKFWNLHMTAKRQGSSETRRSYKNYLGFVNGYDMSKYLVERVMIYEVLFKKYYTSLSEIKLIDLYYKEVELMYILIDNENKGIRVDVERLEKDIEEYSRLLYLVEEFLRAFLNDRHINFNNRNELIKLMIARKLLNLDRLHRRQGGYVLANNMEIWDACQNRVIGALIYYRFQLYMCINTYMKNWLEKAKFNAGYIKVNWIQGRIGEQGARTGRLVTLPNLQGIPKKFKEIFHSKVGDGLPIFPIKKAIYKPLPNLRSYILGDDGHIILSRDYAQQEIRLIVWQGRYNGSRRFYEKLQENNWLDAYEYIMRKLNRRFDFNLSRDDVKLILLSTLYGQRSQSLAKLLKIEVRQAQPIQQYIYSVFFRDMGVNLDENNMKMAGRPYYTIAGRRYYDKMLQLGWGLNSNQEYKYFNTIIQGSGADVMKSAIIKFDKLVKERGYKDKMRMILSIHDELIVSCDKNLIDEGMELMSEAMESVYPDVILKTEGDYGRNFGELVAYDRKGIKMQGV